MKLRTKFTIWGLFSVVIIVLIAAVGIYSTKKLLLAIENVEHTHQMIQHSLMLKFQIAKLEMSEEHYVYLEDKQHLNFYEEAKNYIESDMKFLVEFVRTPSQKSILETIKANIMKWQDSIALNEILHASNKKDIKTEEFSQRLASEDQLLKSAQTQLKNFIKNERILMQNRKSDVVETVYSIGLITALCIIAVIIFYIIIPFLLAKSILKPLKETTFMMKDISEGNADLTKRIKLNTNDEFRVMVEAFNSFVEKLYGMIKSIKTENTKIENASKGFSTTANNLANGAVEVSANAGELYTVAEDVAQSLDYTMEKSADYIDRSNRILNYINSDFNDNISFENTRAMQVKDDIEITSSSLVDINKKIQSLKDIIVDINDLAKQSKILSVNASVQATKAGEYGKGFGVVAKEIQSLALKSEISVKNFFKSIKDLLIISNTAGLSAEQSTKLIQANISNTENLSDMLHKHTDNLVGLVDGMTEISSIFNKQNDDIYVLLKTAKQIKLSTEINADGAKEVQRVADELDEFKLSLSSVIDSFKL